MKLLSHTSDCGVYQFNRNPDRDIRYCDCGALLDYAQALEKLSEVVEGVCGQGYMNCVGSGKIKDALLRVQSLIEK